MTYQFEGHSLDPDRRELRRGMQPVPVEPQVFDLLEYLIRHRTRVVSRDELLASVWHGRIVSESTLASRIFAARRALGDNGRHQRLIRTLSRRGLRFVAEVHEPAETPPPAPGPQRGWVSVLVCRFAGAVALSGRVDPEQAAPALSLARAHATAVAGTWGGQSLVVAIDTVVAWFGSPQAHEDDAERAAGAALEITREVAPAALAAGLQACIGIACGLVVTTATDDLPFVGRPPLLAARLAAAGEGVRVCVQTRRLLGRLFVCRDAPPVAVDDGESIDAATLVGANPGVSRFEALRPPARITVGRDEELALLQRRWLQAGSGEGRAVLIGGEAGIGKSHLVAAFASTLADAAPWRLSCSPQRVHSALHPLITGLERAAGFAAGDAAESRLARLVAWLGSTSDRPAHDGELFGELLGLPVAGGTLPQLSAVWRKALVFERVLAWLDAACAAAPQLVVVEDVHWIDPTTLELLDALIDHIRCRRVLVLVTSRPDVVAPWLDQAWVTTLTLSRLGRADSAALVARAAASRALAPELVERIVERSDGIPLFAEALTHAVLEAGAPDPSADPGRTTAVPPTLQASLAARLERFGAAKPLAQTAAAIGREFGSALLRAVCGLDEATLARQLDALVASGLVHRRGTEPDARYAFKHTLVQEAAQASMPRGRRSAVHRRIAAVIERRFAADAARHPDMLAMHCAEAGLWRRSIEYRLRASTLALSRGAGIEAQAQVESGLALLPRIADGRAALEGRLRAALGNALNLRLRAQSGCTGPGAIRDA